MAVLITTARQLRAVTETINQSINQSKHFPNIQTSSSRRNISNCSKYGDAMFQLNNDTARAKMQRDVLVSRV